MLDFHYDGTLPRRTRRTNFFGKCFRPDSMCRWRSWSPDFSRRYQVGRLTLQTWMPQFLPASKCQDILDEEEESEASWRCRKYFLDIMQLLEMLQLRRMWIKYFILFFSRCFFSLFLTRQLEVLFDACRFPRPWDLAARKMAHGFLENGDGKANWRPAGLYHWRRVCCSAIGGVIWSPYIF